MKKIIYLAFFIIISLTAFGQNDKDKTFVFSISAEVQNAFDGEGKLTAHISLNADRPPKNTSANEVGSWIFGTQIKDWQQNDKLELRGNSNWNSTADWDLNNIPFKKYYLQFTWDESKIENREEHPNFLYSKVFEINEDSPNRIIVEFDNSFSTSKLIENEVIKKFTVESKILSKWWNKPINLNTAVLLPSGYKDNPNKRYPVCYSIGGYGSRYTRANQMVENTDLNQWWNAADAPQIITVFLDGYAQFGDSYQLNSKNNGPYGDALIEEIIPAIDEAFRTTGSAKTRYTAGCSTGGWVSLALQLYYPDSFGGCFSYSADSVSFYKMQLINIYEDKNVFYNSNAIERPSKRSTLGEPEFTIKKEVSTENVEGYSNSYITSRNQWGGWNAVFSPKAENGLPQPIFNPNTGEIDTVVAKHWEKYDLLKYVQANWTELAPKIQGKIHIWMGDMDNYYLNNAMRDFDNYLKTTTNPKSDAEIIFSATCGHCDNFSIKTYLEAIQKQEISKP
jgi:S-formylglutathione hydrolase FrmB